VTIVDDATLPGLFGSSPFDDEGVRSQRTMVVDQGNLATYLLNSYCGRKLKMRTTANASRGLSGAPGVTNGNFFLLAGVRSEMELIGAVKQGLYLTQMIGVNADVATGDFSAGASGLWIDGGELAYPVSEITVAGNLKEMLMGIDGVASNLEFRGAIATPTIRIAERTISGR